MQSTWPEHKPHRELAENFFATIKISNSCLSLSFPRGEEQPGQSDGWVGTAGLVPRSTHGSSLAAITALQQRQSEEWSKSTALAGHISLLWCFFQATLSNMLRYLQLDLYIKEGKPLIYQWASWTDLCTSRKITYLRTNYSWKCIFGFDWKICSLHLVFFLTCHVNRK